MDIGMELENLKAEITLYDGGALSANRLIENLELVENFYEKLGSITGFKKFFQRTIEIHSEEITELDAENINFLDEKSHLENKLNEIIECCTFQVSLLDWYMEKLKSQKLSDKDILLSVDKIYWKGTEPEIVILFELLHNAGLLDEESYDKRYSLIRDHFKNRFNNSFDNKQLGSVYSNIEDDNEAINKLLKKLST